MKIEYRSVRRRSGYSEIKNKSSAIYAQSNAEGILNRLTSHKRSTPIMMLDRMEGNAELKTSVQQMLASRG